jgi:replicative superfamily II helicase
VEGSRNRQIQQFFRYGFGIHHAGMIRAHRSLVEKLYEVGLIKVLSCTSTLAWGVNLPAYAVIIKGSVLKRDEFSIPISSRFF